MEPEKSKKRRAKKLRQNETQEILTPEFDELTDQELVLRDQEIALHSPQESDYTTLEPPSGSEPEKSFYTLTDKDLLEEVVELLDRHPEIDATEIKVQVEKGEVILTGGVPEEKMKLLSAEVIKLLPGVKVVSNQLRLLNP
ncbi:MAG TPA: BON domain-containing protein [Pseudobdellovibrionaceae bacterium]|jgi:hypothetical protein